MASRVQFGLDPVSIAPEVTSALLAANYSPAAMRPYVDGAGRGWLSFNQGFGIDGKPIVRHIQANNALLRYDEWKIFDDVITTVMRQRTSVFSLLRSIVPPQVLPNAMAHSLVQWQMRDNYGQAQFSMDPSRRTPTERANYDTGFTPLPIVHIDFGVNLRELLMSRASGAGLDTQDATEGAAALAEAVEKLTVGTLDEFYFGGGYIYGLTNHPNRHTATLTDPEDADWEPETLCNELADLMDTMYQAKNYGPYTIIYGGGWNKYMNRRFNQYDSTPLAAAVRRLDKVARFEPADFLTGLQIIILEPQAKYCRTIIGMEPTPVQWQNSPFDVQMKLMAIVVPQLRGDYNDNTGILHAVVE